ncbi:hypothetical protein C8F01DRAFT_1058656 [Mycena amicta]|nr:hypothetical protein C8F01DRAFT_1058656 [Mycena amicta]
MPSLEYVRTANAAWKPSYTPVCIVVGGTSGIGQGIAEAIARHTSGKAHIVLVGRNASAAQKIVESFPKNSESTHEFVECDLSLVKNVKRVCAELLSLSRGRVNLLVFTSGAISLESEITEEGLEKSMAVWYYSRWAFVDGLLPGLKAARDKGEYARVLSVLNAGLGKALDVEDMGMKKALGAVRGLADLRETGLGVITYEDLLVKAYAARNSAIAFVHSRPGPVNTPLYSVSPSAAVREAGDAVKLATAATAKTIEECGEHQLYAILNAPSGVSRTGPDGDDIGMESVLGEDADAETLWVHTEQVIRAI